MIISWPFLLQRVDRHLVSITSKEFVNPGLRHFYGGQLLKHGLKEFAFHRPALQTCNNTPFVKLWRYVLERPATANQGSDD